MPRPSWSIASSSRCECANASRPCINGRRSSRTRSRSISRPELLSERHFRKLLQREFKLAQRHHLPLSLLLVDVDDFKRVNDTTEYAFGDEVLKEVARALKANVRETDFAARFGGDEFAILLPHTTPAEAVHTAMRIRKTIAAAVVENGPYKHHVTVSIGIDTFDGRSTTSPDELCRHANKALQEAKHRGKDQVWLYSERQETEGTADPG
jgi:diguanylate cyclase (GGDEF)-like protein